MSIASDLPVTAAETTEGCRYCWMCRHVCPVGHVTRTETYTPHAWALTIESVARGQLVWDADTVNVLYACADCGLCRAHCVTDRPLPDAIAAARAEVVRAGRANPAVAALDEQLRAFGNPYGVSVPPVDPAQAPAALVVGDAAYCLAPEGFEAAVVLMNEAGVLAAPVAVGRSTGWLASSLGLEDTARMLGQALIAEIQATEAREVFVMSPADRWAIEHVYPRRLGLEWPAGFVVRDVTSLLAETLDIGSLRLQAPPALMPPYAYHDPCHAPRLARDHAAPRRLLAAALGAESARSLFWREGRAHPCGAIGGLELTHPDIAARLADARLDDALAAGATMLVTEDSACLHHLRSRPAGTVRTQGLFELLAERLANS